MSFDQFIAAFGLGDLVVEDFFLVQIGVLSGTALLLLVALIFVFLTFKAARGAKRAESEAQQHFATVQNLVAEMRDLHQKSERQIEDFQLAAQDAQVAQLGTNGGVRVSASETTPEAEIDVLTEETCEIPQGETSEATEKDLASARDAASIPSALLSSLLRRKR